MIEWFNFHAFTRAVTPKVRLGICLQRYDCNGACRLVTTSGATILITWHVVKFMQIIWISVTRRRDLWVPDLPLELQWLDSKIDNGDDSPQNNQHEVLIWRCRIASKRISIRKGRRPYDRFIFVVGIPIAVARSQWPSSACGCVLDESCEVPCCPHKYVFLSEVWLPRYSLNTCLANIVTGKLCLCNMG